MSVPKKGTSTGRRLVVHLRDIAHQLKAADKTVGDCEFNRSPTVRKRSSLEAAQCSRETSENLLGGPENMIKHVDACHPVASPISQSILGCPDAVYNVNHHLFVFPVSFKTFDHNLNRILVFEMIGKSLYDLLKLAADDAYRYQKLRRFFFRFYTQPENRPTKNIFKEGVPQILFAKLLKSARPHEEKATRTEAENAARTTLQSNSIVTSEVFSENLLNLPEIVEKMRKRDDNYMRKDFDQCVLDFYLAFYITPEIREKYKCELLPSTPAMKDQMLAIPGEELANELRQSLPQLASPSPALRLPKKGAPKWSPEASCTSRVPYKVFRRYVSNIEDIGNQMLLCDEYKGMSKEEAIQEYYEGFYSGPEMRKKFPHRFKSCSVKMWHHLLSFPPKSREGSPEEPASEFPNTRSVSQPQLEPQSQPEDTLVACPGVATVSKDQGQVEPKKSELSAAAPSLISDEINAAKILDSACKPMIDEAKFKVYNLNTSCDDDITFPTKKAEIGHFNNNYVIDNETLLISSDSDTEWEEPSPQLSPILEEMEDSFQTYIPETPPNLASTAMQAPIILSSSFASQSDESSLDSFAMPKSKEYDSSVEIQNPMITEKVINLDVSQSDGSSLDCFAMPKPKENDTSIEILDPILKEPIDWEDPSAPELPYNVIQVSVIHGKRSAPSQDLASKKMKLINEKVPMDVIEPGTNKPPDNTSPPAEANISPSQDFAVGDSLLDCSHLQRLLDSPSFRVKRLPRT
ncbi:hypothetical protein KR084_012873 [Drosophila pseudotakahashii]|nr:hypothetical protein KR084_012873 [Drosophila pseudotakahashii]